MKEVVLSITLQNFCIERALWPSAKSDGITFRQFIADENGTISNEKLAACMNPVMDFSAINADISPFDESYMSVESHPTADSIKIENIRESIENECLYCDATWVFNNFRITSKEEAMESFSMTEEELGVYMLQMHGDILRAYGLRNNRRSEPRIHVDISE